MRDMIGARQHEMIGDSEYQRRSHCDPDDPRANSPGPQRERKADQRSCENHAEDEQVRRWRHRDVCLSVRCAMDQRNPKMCDDDAHEPGPGSVLYSLHAQKTNDQGGT